MKKKKITSLIYFLAFEGHLSQKKKHIQWGKVKRKNVAKFATFLLCMVYIDTFSYLTT